MNTSQKRILVISLLLGVSLISLNAPLAVSAFWPFSGQVKGAQTNQNSQPSVFSFFLKKIINGRQNNPSPIEIGTSEVGTTGIANNKPNLNGQLDHALKNGKITEAQKAEIISRIEAIKTKQQELISLEKSLNDWMKTNNLPASLLGGQKPPRPSISPTSSLLESTVENENE